MMRGYRPIDTRPYSPDVSFCKYLRLKPGIQTIGISNIDLAKKWKVHLFCFEKMNWIEQIIDL